MKHLNEKGSSAVEFAIVMPLLLVLVFGIIEFSLALYDKAVITNASREGARAGIVFKDTPVTDDEIAAIVTNYCQNKLVTFGVDKNITSTVTRAGYNPGDDLTVNVTYRYEYLVLPGFIATLTDGITMAATTVMRME